MRIDNLHKTNVSTNFGFKFKLNPKVVEIIEKNTGMSINEIKSKSICELSEEFEKRANKKKGLFSRNKKTNFSDRQEFYRAHPDLVPRNVYLLNGRITSVEEVNKVIDDFCKKPLKERVADWFKAKFMHK